MSCSSCGKPNAKARCGSCRSAHYCNDVCQKNHWGAHKGPCKATRAAAPPQPPPPPAGPFVLGRHCGFCRSEVALSRDGVGIKCGSCVRVAYCDEECREAHLPAHEAACAEATLARLHAGEGELAGAEANLKRAMEEAKSELNGESYGYVPVRQRKREAEEALVHMDPYGLRPLHVSFDIDACDPSIAPATGTPVKGAHALILSAAARVTCDRLCRPGGLSYREAHFILECISCAPTPNRARRCNCLRFAQLLCSHGAAGGVGHGRGQPWPVPRR